MIGVLLVDDHPVVRIGLRALLETEPDLRVVAEASGPEEALVAVRTTVPQLILMDLRLGAGRSGAELTRRIRERADAPPVLVLTHSDLDADILAAIEAGASGYVLKDAPPDELLAAVRAAAAGESALAPLVATRLLDRLRSPAQALSEREREVLRAVADGETNSGVATRLRIAEPTVKSHLVRIFTKLGVGNRTAAIAEARRRGLLG